MLAAWRIQTCTVKPLDTGNNLKYSIKMEARSKVTVTGNRAEFIMTDFCRVSLAVNQYILIPAPTFAYPGTKSIGTAQICRPEDPSAVAAAYQPSSHAGGLRTVCNLQLSRSLPCRRMRPFAKACQVLHWLVAEFQVPHTKVCAISQSSDLRPACWSLRAINRIMVVATATTSPMIETV